MIIKGDNLLSDQANHYIHSVHKRPLKLGFLNIIFFEIASYASNTYIFCSLWNDVLRVAVMYVQSCSMFMKIECL